MLVLCSNGLSSETLLARIREKTAGCKTAALVVTADNEYKESKGNTGRYPIGSSGNPAAGFGRTASPLWRF